jgi:hypothetical protein
MDEDYDFWEEHPDPSDEDIADLPRASVTCQREYREPPPSDEPGWWAAEAVMKADAAGGVPLKWRVVLGVCAAVGPDDESVIHMIGTSPIEDMVREYGDHAMDLIEPAADKDAILYEALTGVWCHSNPIRPRIDHYLARRLQ